MSEQGLYNPSASIPSEFDSKEFIESIVSEIERLLSDDEANYPPETERLWRSMSETERLDFIYSCGECFYWVYCRRNKVDPVSYPDLEDMDQSKRTRPLAAFCCWVLGTEAVHDSYEPEEDNGSGQPQSWLN